MRKCTLVISLCFLILSEGAVNASTMRPEAEKNLARDIYKQFIEIQSGYTTGSTTPVVEAAVARLKAAGFTDNDIFVGGASPTKANLVVRYRGTGAQKPVLLLAHTDVVEAKREDWSMDPFRFIERDGYFYGRGSFDDKAAAAIWIANLIQYKREGYKPSRDIIVALTADEEGGGPYNGVKWLIKNHKNLINADFAINEGGWGDLMSGNKIANYLQVSEKSVMDFRLEAHSKGGHSSLPVSDNAIYRLAAALDRLSNFNFPLETNTVTENYFKQLSMVDAVPMKKDLAQVAANSKQAMERVAAASPAWNATLRTTCVATQLEGGHAKNALPQLAAANINCRVLPDQSPESVQQALEKAIDDKQISVRLTNEFVRSPVSPLRPDIIKAANEVTDEMWPGVPAIPTMVMGATDGRELRSAGIPTYGIMGLFVDRNDIRAHGRDERMSVTSFYEGQAFLYELVKRLSA